MSAPKTKKSKYLFMALRLLVVTLGILWAILWLSHEGRWAKLTDTFQRMNIGVFVLALVIFAWGQAVIAFRWRLLLKTQSIFIDLPAALRLHFLGLFYNNFMPSSVGGDLLRAWYVTKHTDKKFEAVLSVFVDRIVGLLSTLIIAGFFYLVFLRGDGAKLEFTADQGGPNFIAQHKLAIAWAVGILLAALCLLMVLKQTRARLLAIGSKLWIKGLALLKRTKDAALIYCCRPLTMLAVFGLTVFMQVTVITGYWLLGRTLGIEAGLKYYYVFFTLTWVLGAVPVSIGGAVVVESLLVYLFAHYAGVDEALALALALCQRVIWMLSSLPGGVIHLIGAHLPKDFSIDYNEQVD